MSPQYGLSRGTVYSHRITAFVALDHTTMSFLKNVTATFCWEVQYSIKIHLEYPVCSRLLLPCMLRWLFKFQLGNYSSYCHKANGQGRGILIGNVFTSSTTFLTISASTLETWSCLHLYLPNNLRHKDDTAELHLARLAGVGRRP